ncbi:MAG: hypothetical protein Fur006_69560 [Coleofasciculaceae cyanobacterium]
MNKFELQHDDVVSMDAQLSFAKTQTCQIFELQRGLQQQMQSIGHNWLHTGVYCKVLKTTGGGWQQGKMYIRLEFVPDEPPQTTDAVLSPNNQ